MGIAVSRLQSLPLKKFSNAPLSAHQWNQALRKAANLLILLAPVFGVEFLA